MTTSISTCMLPNSLCREMVKHHGHAHLCVWNCRVRCMLRHMCTCVYIILNQARMALYFANCLFPPSATAAKAWEMLLASLRRSPTLAEASCEHICKFMNCNINMTIAGGWHYKKDGNSNTASGWQTGGDWQWPGSTQSGWDWQWSGSSHASASGSTGTAAADEVQMEN